MTVTRLDAIPTDQWQKTARFPDWKGYVDDTLAMNSMISFHCWHGQGAVYLRLGPKTEGFVLFVNGTRADTGAMRPGGAYRVDIADAAVNGTNTLQVSGILPVSPDSAVEVFIPHPVVLEGSPEEEGVSPAALALIDEIVAEDAANGFPGAQLRGSHRHRRQRMGVIQASVSEKGRLRRQPPQDQIQAAQRRREEPDNKRRSRLRPDHLPL